MLETGADFSSCRVWRYTLWRRWEEPEYDSRVMFIGLNPSTADEVENDPTVRRCINFAKDWGYGGMFMMNAYGFRATDPKVMKAAADPVGPGNNEALASIANEADLIVAAWGNHCTAERASEICELINAPIMCLGQTASGMPKHPLYLRKDTPLQKFWKPVGKKRTSKRRRSGSRT